MKNMKLTNITLNATFTMVLAVTICGAHLVRAAAPIAPGEQRRWALEFRARLEQGAGRPIEFDLSGDWISTVSAVRPDEYDVMLQVANARVSGGQNVPVSQSEQLRHGLERPFWGTYRRDGSLVTVHFYKDTDPGDRNLLQMVATESQFVIAPADRQSWTVLERDGAGQYQAVYRRDSANAVIKHKLNYTETNEAGKATSAVHTAIDQSEIRFTLDRDGGVATLDASNRVRLAVSSGSSGQLTAVTETHLAGLRTGQAPETIGSLTRAMREVVSSPVRTHETDPETVRARLDGQLLEGRTTESVLSAALPWAAKAGEDQLVGERLAALFRHRPETSAAALDLLRKTGANKRITDALGAAGSPTAVGVLAVIASDRALSRPLRIDALTAFIVMQHPSVEAMRAPAALLDDDDASVASAARITSGALARAGREAHAEEAGKIDAALVMRYPKARDTKELGDLLAALGNSAGASAVPVIESALGDPREAVRSAAVGALRLADGPEIDGLLATAIAKDRDPEVRASAIFAAGFHHPMGSKLVASLVQSAKTDPAEHVRVAAVNLLVKNAKAVPDLAGTLTWVAQHDPKPGVQRLAQQALEK